MVMGYMHPGYADSLSEFGTPRKLPKSGGAILERQIPGFPYRDAMGCYPLYACPRWSNLHADLEDLAGELVSLALVTDPFGEYDAAYLKDCFRDVVIPFKQHFIVDLSRPADSFIVPHHRRYARQALRDLWIEECTAPENDFDQWMSLYSTLIERHRITGITAFSRKAFSKQFAVPGLKAFRAIRDSITVGMLLWYVQGDVAYYHLGAYSDQGYASHASFALFWFAIEYFAADGLRWLNLGAGAGVGGDGTDGLSRFKQGWSTGTHTAYFCGRIFDHKRYSEIVQARDLAATSYFPAYRKGEFG